MRKKLLSLCLVVTMIISLIPAASAASEEAIVAAESLYELGLFNGTGKDANGNPVFDLDSVPSRHQAVVLLVRLLGKDEDAKSGTWNIPFTDVAEWAKPYVGYAYANGLTSGTSSTTYSGNRDATVAQYLTFVLRALGYTSGIDFQYNSVFDFADKIGLTDGRYNQNTTNFTRGDVAIISYRALNCKLKDTNQTLVKKLYDDNSINYIEISNAGLGNVSGLQTINTPTNIRIDIENGVNFLVWDTPAQNVSVYHVMISENRDSDYEIYYPADSDKSYAPLNNTGLFEMKAGTTYYFKVRAYYHDDTHNLEYFSDYTEPITFYYSGSTQNEDAPKSVISELLLYLNRATNWEEAALLAAKISYDASSSASGVYYAKHTQTVFRQTTESLNKAIELCSQYSNLAEVKNNLLYIFNLENQYVNSEVTTSNYLSFVEQVILNSHSIIDKYEDSILITGTFR